MSSSFLYLAIVAVWAFVLVPRWIRRQQAHTHASIGVELDVDVDVEYAADHDAGAQHYYYYDDVDDEAGGGYSPDAREVTYQVGAGPDSSRSVPPARTAGTAAPPRSRALRARRRLLMMHLLLMAVAAACVVLKITSWLVLIPPAGMLGMYLLLLRAAANADAEQARRRAALAARARAARQRGYEAAIERDAEPTAQVIDISARVGDQLYDQYADATVRAVGD